MHESDGHPSLAATKSGGLLTLPPMILWSMCIVQTAERLFLLDWFHY